MVTTTFGVVQFACSDNVDENVAAAARLVREAAGQGAQVVLVQELFEGLYFCQEERAEHFARARPLDKSHATLHAMRELAAELKVVLPVSLFEQAGQAYYNSLVMVDADGGVLGLYRKSHIPDGPGYEEKFYFRPGDTGFKVWPTRYGTIGVGICWDQWFPEAARSMALMGADALLYPTAIGSEPVTGYDSREHWRTVMRGHAGANIMPVMAANRIGIERFGERELTFYGSSFIAGPHGELVAEAGRSAEVVLTASFDLEAIRAERAAWGLFRDRRPELYGRLATADGSTKVG
ncbi:N-carbamoylputrescine amidohydrolase [Labrys miyagiensis]|uniref:N-carbamoylputrescine amidohydrolase n=1 Tax=Labrys miyagiensis TaxID=346912 RepID=A0ABQ6CEU9_9HYPH|nr:N-carbamoylputrescine amidase [Labrys miyagiensis]GLS18319.1 N-carbamoylputrescine amidohydrolase [Labrys miyagiensis]